MENVGGTKWRARERKGGWNGVARERRKLGVKEVELNESEKGGKIVEALREGAEWDAGYYLYNFLWMILRGIWCCVILTQYRICNIVWVRFVGG